MRPKPQEVLMTSVIPLEMFALHRRGFTWLTDLQIKAGVLSQYLKPDSFPGRRVVREILSPLGIKPHPIPPHERWEFETEFYSSMRTLLASDVVVIREPEAQPMIARYYRLNPELPFVAEMLPASQP